MSQPKQSPSIKEIAAIAGVSTATVSRVLNDKGGYGEETRRRVLAVLQSNGYIGNMAAKALRESRTRTVGLILPSIDNPFFSSLAYHLEERLDREGHFLLICNSLGDAERERNHYRSLLAKQVDGILMISDLSALAGRLPLDRVPLVVLDRRPDPALAVPYVVNDDRAAGKAATEHLLARGCLHLMFLAFPQAADNGASSLRELGYLDALKEAGIPVDQNYILRRPGLSPATEEAEALVGRFLDEGRFPLDGIVAVSEKTAVGALFALRKRGVSVPGEVRLLGFDNTILSEVTHPGLSSVDRCPEAMADTAVRLLLERPEKGGPLLHEIPFRLAERESSR